MRGKWEKPKLCDRTQYHVMFKANDQLAWETYDVYNTLNDAIQMCRANHTATVKWIVIQRVIKSKILFDRGGEN